MKDEHSSLLSFAQLPRDLTARLQNSDLATIASFGDEPLGAAADLSARVFAEAEGGAKEKTGSTVGGLLATIRSLTNSTADGRSEKLKINRLAQRTTGRVARLLRLQRELDPIAASLKAHLSAAQASHTFWACDGSSREDKMEVSSKCMRLDDRFATLQGSAITLDQCRLILWNLLSAERAIEDQLIMARDVAAPIAVQMAKLTRLSAEVQGTDVIARQVDVAAGRMVNQDLARLKAVGLMVGNN